MGTIKGAKVVSDDVAKRKDKYKPAYELPGLQAYDVLRHLRERRLGLAIREWQLANGNKNAGQD